MVLSICGHAVGHDKTPGCLGNVPEPFRGCGGAHFVYFWPETSQNRAPKV